MRIPLRGAPDLSGRRAGAPRLLAALMVPVSGAVGCAPMVNVLGVYFPPWLVSAVAGLVIAYGLVWWLGQRPGTRSVAQSGLLFCSLTVVLALLLWWGFFSYW